MVLEYRRPPGRKRRRDEGGEMRDGHLVVCGGIWTWSPSEYFVDDKGGGTSEEKGVVVMLNVGLED